MRCEEKTRRGIHWSRLKVTQQPRLGCCVAFSYIPSIITISMLSDLWYNETAQTKRDDESSPRRKDKTSMKKVKLVISIIWFLFVSLSSPLWIGCIYMNITGHGKGYAYDMGSEADIAVFFGVLLLLLWLLAILPVTISLCKKIYYKKKSFVWLPLLTFVGFFAVGICILGWNEFIRLFGYGY